MDSTPQAQSQYLKVGGHVDLQNTLRNLHQVLSLGVHILDICPTLEDMLQAGQLHTPIL